MTLKKLIKKLKKLEAKHGGGMPVEVVVIHPATGDASPAALLGYLQAYDSQGDIAPGGVLAFDYPAVIVTLFGEDKP